RVEGEQIDHHFGDVLPLQLPWRRTVPGQSREVRLDATGHDAADLDSIVADVEHHRFGEAQQPELGRVVCGATGHRVLSGQRPDVDDPATPLRAHVWNRFVGGVEGAVEIRLDHLLPFFRRDLVDRRKAADSRIVDENVEAAMLRHGFGDQALDLVESAHVAGESRHRPLRFAVELAGDALDFVRVPGAYHYIRTGTGKCFRGGGADSLASAGDEGDLSFEIHAVRSF